VLLLKIMDRINAKIRSRIMSRIKGKNTNPGIVIRGYSNNRILDMRLRFYGKAFSTKLRQISMDAIVMFAVLATGFLPVMSAAQESAEDLAKQLSNPIASLISVPFVYKYNQNIGPTESGSSSVLNIQPVIPISISENWNVISRTILPIINQDDVAPGTGNQFGLGDTVQSFFFSPKEPTASGLVWGAGPVLLLPTATNSLLGAEKWGIGPTVVALKQKNGWTVGGLANHIWSVAGDDTRPDISNTFLQPFVSYTTPEAWTFTVNTESTYNWKAEEWSAPVFAQVSKVVKIGNQLTSIGVGARYWAKSFTNGPQGWGLNLSVTFLYPKK
jgi:hypothetical protein